MFAENNFEPSNNIFRKGRRENFYSVELFWYRRNVLIELNCTELQKIYAQYKQSLYNQLGIVKMTYSI